MKATNRRNSEAMKSGSQRYVPENDAHPNQVPLCEWWLEPTTLASTPNPMSQRQHTTEVGPGTAWFFIDRFCLALLAKDYALAVIS
jgi:hypothetical protein